MSKCPRCGAPLQLKQGVSKKTGKSYKFWGCTNYPECDYTTNTPPNGEEGSSTHQAVNNTIQGFDSRLKGVEESVKRTERMVERIGKMLKGEEKVADDIPVVEDPEFENEADTNTQGDYPAF